MIPYDINILQRLSKSLFVVILKDDSGNLTLLASPGENKPWYTKNKRIADFHAKANSGMACTWGEAWSLLLKAYPGFEDELIQRIAKAKHDITQRIIDRGVPTLGAKRNGRPQTPPSV